MRGGGFLALICVTVAFEQLFEQLSNIGHFVRDAANVDGGNVRPWTFAAKGFACS